MQFPLRDYQDDAIEDVRVEMRTHQAVLLVLSTGAGKTVIFSHIANSAVAKGRKVLILAHRDQLIKQAVSKLRSYDLNPGIIMAGFTPQLHENAQVASVQTLVRRLGRIKFQPDLIIIDEAHLSAAKSYVKIVEAFPTAKILGVTGSPCRLDNKPLGREHGGLYDVLVQGISIRDLIDRGFLVQPKVYAPAEQLDLSSVRKKGGDYDTTELAELVDKPKLTGSAVAQYKKICPGAPAVAWCVTIEHAKHVAEEFNAAGIKAEMLCGDDDTTRRDAVLGALSRREIQVVTFVGILVEGVDCPEIAAIILLRPTLSLASYLQVIGRGLRSIYKDGLPIDTDEARLAAIAASHKKCCYVLDHGGLTFRHGLADEEREWSLDWGERKKTGKKKKDEQAVDLVQCKKCFAVVSPAPACPECGHVFENNGRKIEHDDGELMEITPEMAEAMRKRKNKEVKSAKTLEELQRIAAQRGYSPGWAKHTFEAKQRVRAKYQKMPPPEPPRPPEPSLEELQQMTLEELEKVAAAQGWPTRWPSEFYYQQRMQGVDHGSTRYKQSNFGR